MDSWGYLDTLHTFFILLWRSYLTTMSSGISVGLALSFASVTLIVALVLLAIKRMFSFKKRRIKRLVRALRGKRMSATEREEYEKSIIADGIQDILDEMFLRGQMTGEKRKWWQRYLGQKLDIQDLLKDDEAKTKEKIKRRLLKEHGVVVEFKKEDVVEEPRLKRFTGGKFFKPKAA